MVRAFWGQTLIFHTVQVEKLKKLAKKYGLASPEMDVLSNDEYKRSTILHPSIISMKGTMPMESVTRF